MRKILSTYIVTFSLFAGAESAPPPEKEVWRSCNKTSECIIAAGACGPEAVNRKYRKPFEEHANKLKPFVDCSPPTTQKFNAVCEEKKCALK